MEAGMQSLIEAALQQGIWAALYIYLFFRMLKEKYFMFGLMRRLVIFLSRKNGLRKTEKTGRIIGKMRILI